MAAPLAAIHSNKSYLPHFDAPNTRTGQTRCIKTHATSLVVSVATAVAFGTGLLAVTTAVTTIWIPVGLAVTIAAAVVAVLTRFAHAVPVAGIEAGRVGVAVAVRIVTVLTAISIFIYAVVANSFACRRIAAVLGTVALIFTGVACGITTNGIAAAANVIEKQFRNDRVR